MVTTRWTDLSLCFTFYGHWLKFSSEFWFFATESIDLKTCLQISTETLQEMGNVRVSTCAGTNIKPRYSQGAFHQALDIKPTRKKSKTEKKHALVVMYRFPRFPNFSFFFWNSILYYCFVLGTYAKNESDSCGQWQQLINRVPMLPTYERNASRWETQSHTGWVMLLWSRLRSVLPWRCFRCTSSAQVFPRVSRWSSLRVVYRRSARSAVWTRSRSWWLKPWPPPGPSPSGRRTGQWTASSHSGETTPVPRLAPHLLRLLLYLITLVHTHPVGLVKYRGWKFAFCEFIAPSSPLKKKV